MIVRHRLHATRPGQADESGSLVSVFPVSVPGTQGRVAGEAHYEMSYWIHSFPCFTFQVVRKLGHHGNMKKEMEGKKTANLPGERRAGELKLSAFTKARRAHPNLLLPHGTLPQGRALLRRARGARVGWFTGAEAVRGGRPVSDSSPHPQRELSCCFPEEGEGKGEAGGGEGRIGRGRRRGVEGGGSGCRKLQCITLTG